MSGRPKRVKLKVDEFTGQYYLPTEQEINEWTLDYDEVIVVLKGVFAIHGQHHISLNFDDDDKKHLTLIVNVSGPDITKKGDYIGQKWIRNKKRVCQAAYCRSC
jgi:hypothetical protein